MYDIWADAINTSSFFKLLKGRSRSGQCGHEVVIRDKCLGEHTQLKPMGT